MNTTDRFYLEIGKSIECNGNYYKTIAFLGKGGNGTTFLVQSTNGNYHGQIFALKVLYKMSQNRRIDRFLEEIEFLKEQKHPSLVQYYDSGKYYERPFLIMNYLPNTLADKIKQGLTIGESLVYCNQLLSALQVLQEQNILHRDIKPQNIFISGVNAVLGDFGLLKRLDVSENEEDKNLDKNFLSETINDTEMVGYVAMPKFYRTPELVNYANGKGALHIKSDIFQLGLVLAEMFTGKNPLIYAENIKSPVKVNKLHKESDAKINSSYGNEISILINKMLNLQPESRPDVKQLLERFTDIYFRYSQELMKLQGKFI